MAHAFPITQANVVGDERGDAMSVECRQIPSRSVVRIWAATALASWVLVGFVVVGVWWIVT